MDHRPYPPLDRDHPLVGATCKACARAFVAGDVLALIPLPPDDPEDIERMVMGHVYTSPALPLHWACAIDYEEA